MENFPVTEPKTFVSLVVNKNLSSKIKHYVRRKVLILTSLLVICCGKSLKTVPSNDIAIGQTIEYNPNPENTRLAILHDKLINSESYQRSEKLTDSLIASFPDKFDKWEMLKDEEAFRAWLKENISKTTFKSIEDAIELYDQVGEAAVKDQKENAEFYELWMNTDPDSWEFTFYSP